MTNAELGPEPAAAGGTRIGRFVDRGWARVDGAWASLSSGVAGSPAGQWWKRVEQPNAADWALLAAICALAAVTFLYGDVKATFEHSFNFLDAVLAGRPRDFYQIAIENSTFGHPAVYDVPIYAIFAVWNLPTYLLYRYADFDYLTSTPAQLWLKLMLILFALVATWLVVRIAKTLGMTSKRSKWVAFYFLSSMSLFVPVFVIVQYDIISVTFMLAGLSAYLKGQTRAFLLWFLAANTLKLFALFIFIPLVLLREKRLPRAFLQIVFGVLGLALCRLLYRGDLAFQASTGGFTDIMLDRLRIAGFAWQSDILVPIFVVFIVGLAIFAYAKRPTSQRELQAFALYLSLAAFLVFCAVVPLNPYWIALVAPFSILIIFANPRFLTLNSLLEVSISTSLFLIYMLVGYSMYNAGMFNDLLFGQFIPPASPQRFSTPGQILNALGISGNIVIFLVGFMIACVLAVLIVNYPRPEFVAGMPNAQTIKRSVVWIRLAALVGFMSLLFGMYLIPARPTVYSSTSSAPELTETDILAPNSDVQEELEFDTAVTVDTIKVGLDASAVTWIDSAAITLTITDEDGSTVFSGAKPANSIGVGLAAFPAGGLSLDAGETYTVRLSGFDSEGAPAYVQVNPDQDRFLTTENGRLIDGDLVMVWEGTTAP
ncbi:hypothetical protein R8Z57_11330 [Microbacterium sp. M3]|uniref:DUF2029 domain-containing protein n=1 Tax=Microbacterium arthrosphaerae TaxID=792652 RepID=A0ABU4H200_9MICO|nr:MULTISPECIES: hypothetical protein [Microbacterium]MDW4573363.1 hypothetical protein [Microbacterium arthrosphaerae]MDW7607218.1 hypothetical protein [Microbacterium sp. M3]